ncbi:hypothetical protein GL263_01360 [Streptomyces durbertensis]|uniref:DUF559 domain-containing protein n=1 Tax=Streptomyces durbertensis TaxID=2448886 RepID=A0ABR6EA65_9ACTN|nr:hypothetical protein [Streptomyces durbertensis]MBB1242232.1 hypothetical protein [Streptomyces durbertensis]
MTQETPLSPRPLSHLSDVSRRVVTTAGLRAQGVSAAVAKGRCRPGGPWQTPLPGVFLLHPGRPTDEERLRAVLLYAAGTHACTPPSAEARPIVSGLAALALHGFRCVPRIADLAEIDVLVPRARRPRSTGWARVLRTHSLPNAVDLHGVAVAPVARALADAVGRLTDPDEVRRMLTETVRDGHCEAHAIVRELGRARLLSRPQVVDAVDTLLAEGRALAESRLYRLVAEGGLPDPCWNVELRQPGGPRLAVLDAYWPEQGVAVEIDSRAHQRPAATPALWPGRARQRETLAKLGVTVVSPTPERLRDSPHDLLSLLRTALMTADDRPPATYLLVQPR